MASNSISIALCTYNGARFLQEQLDSVASQTLLPGEMVICDDRSEDKTVEIIKSFAKTSPFPVRLSINEKRLGVVKNFEKAINMCKSVIIALSDQDDVWLPEKLAMMQKRFREESKIDYLFSDASIIDEEGNSLGYTYWQTNQFSSFQQKKFRAGRQLEILFKIGSTIPGCAMAFRRPLPTYVLPFPQELYNGHHDGWIALMLSASGYKGGFISTPLLKYRVHVLQSSSGVSVGLARVRLAAKTGEDVFDEIEALYVMALRRLEENGKMNDADRDFFEQKITHLRTRRTIRTLSKYKRISLILKELVTGRYEMFSRGSVSAARDIFL